MFFLLLCSVATACAERYLHTVTDVPVAMIFCSRFVLMLPLFLTVMPKENEKEILQSMLGRKTSERTGERYEILSRIM